MFNINMIYFCDKNTESMATLEEVSQKVNEHCTEKQYTLNDDFRSKFSEKFAEANPDADINDEKVLNSIKFNIDTAFSAASKELKIKDETWKTKEADYLKQIETLKKNQKVEGFKLPDDLKNELEEIKQFKEEKQKQEKRANILEMAKKNVRKDLHSDLEDVLSIMELDYSKDEKVLAEQLNSNFTKLYKGRIGNIKPLSPGSTVIKDEDIIESVKSVKIK